MSVKLPIGPIHPMLKEPINLTFYVEGEVVVDAEPNIGFVHRGIEKLAERKTWFQNLYLLEKVCGICSSAHQGCYAQGAEKIYEKEPPEKALYIRTLMWELERLHSHLLWLGVIMHEIGFDTLFMYTWKDREYVLDLVELISGRRVGYSISTIGGVRRDVTYEMLKKAMDVANYIAERAQFYEKVVLNERTVLDRTQGVGYLSKTDAIRLNTVGPTARASGVRRDVRQDMPYGVYEEAPFSIVVDTGCDVLARILVRIREMVISADVIKWIVFNMPKNGAINLKISPFMKPPENEAISRVEAPRGELFYYLKSNGSLNPERIKIRTPTLANIASVIHMVKGHYIADIPPIVAGIDPCMSCMDRVVIVDVNKEKKTVMSHEELHRYSLKWYKRNKLLVREERR
ncbi:MAG: hydrogenase large subunit [Candidatus Njordarchaeales archaeon]